MFRLVQVTALQQYKFFIPLLALVTGLLFLFLRLVSDAGKKRIVSYLNLLFIVLAFIEIGYAVVNSTSKKPADLSVAELQLEKVNGQFNRNIYFFVMDEYVGSSTLKKYFGFQNDSFENELTKRSFWVAQSPNSNYNYTPFSILSILNMDYVPEFSRKELKSGAAVSRCVEAIRKNRFTFFLTDNSYNIINNSFLPIGNGEYIKHLFLPTEERLLLDKTFGHVLWNDLLCTVNSNRFHFFIKDGIARIELYNQAVYAKTKKNINTTAKPQFMYSHFMMPHFPYFRTKGGKLRNLGQVYRESNEGRNIKSYVEYLQYCNSVMIELVDKISKDDPEAIVIVASDHGIREAAAGDKFLNEFANFLAVKVPDKKYEGFTDTMGMVNVFRCILRNQFRQKIPLIENKMVNVNPGLIIKAPE